MKKLLPWRSLHRQGGNWEWGRFLFETHPRSCDCSYCRRGWLPAGLWLPANRGPTSWRVLFLSLFFVRFYLRWTPRRKGGAA